MLTDLGVPPGLPSKDFNTPRVFGINDFGAVVGTIHTSAGDLPSRWFIYDRGRFTVLPPADPTDLGGAAIGINDGGNILGFGETVGGESQYFLLTPDPNGGLTPRALVTTP